MARENVTISIKGDIKDLEEKISQSKAIINDATKSISVENKNLSQTQQELIDVQGIYSKEIKNTKDEINKYLEVKKRNGKLSKEESKDLVKLRTGLTLLNNKTKELVDTERKKIAQTRQAISASKNLIDSQKIAIETTESDLKSKKKTLEFEDKYQQALRASNVAVNERIKTQEDSRNSFRKEVLIYEPLESKINTYTSKTNKLDQALKKKVITTDEYRKSLKILNQELAKATNVDKFGYSNRAISSSAISKGVGIKESDDAKTKAVQDSTKAQKEYSIQLEKNKKKEQEYAKAKYETVTSLLAQKRAEEQLEKTLKINAKNESTRLKDDYIRKYKNTHAQNAYNDALKHLNTLKKAGIISSLEYDNALKKEQASLKSSTTTVKKKTEATSNLANATIRYLRWAGTIAGVVYAGKRAWDATIGTGIEVNKIIESNTFGIAALTSANTKMIDSLGNSLSPIQKFVKGQELAKGVLSDLRTEAVKTYATFPQLIEIFQQATGQTLGMGDAFGTTIDEINKNTVQLASRMSNIAGAIGMPMDRVREEIRSLLSGNASTDSLISTMIFGSPGAANKAIKEAKTRVGGLAELLDQKFKPFDILADTKSFQKSVLLMQDSWQRAMGDMISKSGVFKDITELFYDTAQSIINNSDEIVSGFDNVYKASKQVVSAINDIAAAAATPIAITGQWTEDAKKFRGTGVNAYRLGYKELTTLVKETHQELESLRLRDSGILGFTVRDGDIKQVENLLTVYQRRLRQISEAGEKAEKERLKNEEALSKKTKTGKLIANYSYSKEAEEKVNKRLEKSESKIASLLKEKESHLKLIEEHQLEIERSLKVQKIDTDYISLITEKVKKAKEATQSVELEISKETTKQKDTLNKKQELEEKRRLSKIKSWGEELSISKQLELYSNGIVKNENLQIQKQQIKIAGLGAEWEASKNTKNANKILLQIYEKSAILNAKITSEKEKQSSLAYKEEQSIFKEFEDKDKQELKDLKEAIKEIEDSEITIDIKLNGFDEVSNSIAKLVNSFTSAIDSSSKYATKIKVLSKEQSALVKGTDAYNRKTEEGKKLTKQNTVAQVGMYSDMTGAMAGFYDEDDDRRKRQLEVQKVVQATQMAMQVAQMVQSTAFTGLFVAQEATKATAAGVTAVATAAASSPWTGLATAAAMAAMLASFGVMFTSKGINATFDAHSSQKANEGKGSVLGDMDAQSESISNSLTILEDFAKPEFTLMSQMTKSLKSIEMNIGGLTGNIIKQGGFALGEGANIKQFSSISGQFDDLYNKTIGQFSQLFLGLDKLIIASPISKILGGVFGKTSQSLTDAGLSFQNQLLPNALEDLKGSSYQAITTTKKSWFKKSSSTSTRFQGLDDETERQFELVLNNLYDTTLLAGEGLGATTSAVESELSDFVVRLGKISLKGKSGEEIQKTLTAIFGRVGDEMSKEAFPALVPFQQIGEAMFETMTRVSTGMQESEYYINRLGTAFDDITYTSLLNKQGDVALESLTQSIVRFERETFGANSSLIPLIDSLSGTAQESFDAYRSLDILRDRITFLNQDIQGLTSNMLLGGNGIDELSNSFASYFENFLTEEKKLTYQTSQMQKEFQKLNVTMPISKDGFSDILNGLDLTTESGQELYGRLISLSEGFADVSSEIEKAIQNIQDALDNELNSFENIINGVGEISDSFISAISSISSTIENLLGKKTGSDNTQMQIEKYWTKRSDVDNLLSKGSNISTSEVKELNSLISEISGLSTSIQSGYGDNTDITSNLVADLTGIKARVTSSNKSLEEVIADGMSKLATEETLSSVNEYSKAMLLDRQRELKKETESLSSATLTHGDYIGKQEQIDISKQLGVSYDSAEPLIEQLQALSISKNPEEDLKKILGFTGKGDLDYDKTIASQISSLSKYITGVDVSGTISGVESDVASNVAIEEKRKAKEAKFEADKQNFYSRLKAEQSSFNDNSSKYLNEMSVVRGHWGVLEPDYAKGKSMYTYRGSVNNGHYNNTSNFTNALQDYKDIQELAKEKQLKGYSSGGYTGDGGKFEIAGFVHKREHVVESEKLQAIGGSSALENMIQREIINKKTNSASSSSTFENTNNKNGIIEELQKGQKMLEQGFNILASQMDELIDFNDERRSEGYSTKVTGEVIAIAG